MKVLLSWLNEFAPFGDDVDALVVALNEIGLAVEEVVPVGQPIEGIVVARVLDRAKHPNADRIGLVFVDTGNGEPLQICCGAFNMQPGDLVPLATVGTVMPDGRAISRSKMRGEWSNGMLCSARELGLGEDHEGIWILPEGLTLGDAVFEAVGIRPDVVFDLDLTRNRPDAWGHLGVARDLAAWLRLPFAPPDVSDVVEEGSSAGLTVSLLDTYGCGRFAARRITGVRVTESPAWIVTRLERAGMRAINNVVDVSNLIMLELNRPNHAYDESKLGGGGFEIRAARAGEELVTLDGVTRVFAAGDTLICDALGTPIGVGGIMGGANSEVDDATTTVALEQAWFDPDHILETSARLGLRSEASARFERGCDPYDEEYAARRFVQLLRHSCPAAKLEAAVVAEGQLPAFAPVTVRVERVNRLLGTTLDGARIKELLDPIGYLTTLDSGATGELTVAIPTWRFDSTTEVDVIEEIARQYGYSRIAVTVPNSPHAGALTARQQDRRQLRQILLGLGVTEAMPLPFLAPADLERARVDADGLIITNPLAAEESVLRTSLLPGLLKATAYNSAHRRTGARFFEIGHVYRRTAAPAELPDEREVLAVSLAGSDAFAAKAALDEIFAALGFPEAEVVADAPSYMHPTRSARVELAEAGPVGWVGEVDPDVLSAHDIGERVAWLELDLDALLAQPHGQRTYRAVSRFPSSDVDLAFVVDDQIPAGSLQRALRRAAGDLLVDVHLFDVYRGEGIPDGARSLAFTLRLQASDRTLTDAEVSEVRVRCIEAVTAEFDAELRH